MAAGCADSRVASKENLADALNHDYLASQDCPFHQADAVSLRGSGEATSCLAETRHRLDALGRCRFVGAGTDYPQGGDTINRYVLTAAGSHTEGAGKFLLWTPPGDQRGEVHAAGGLRRQAADQGGVSLCDERTARAGRKRMRFGNAFPDVAKSLASQPVDDATLMLTHDGWVLTY